MERVCIFCLFLESRLTYLHFIVERLWNWPEFCIIRKTLKWPESCKGAQGNWFSVFLSSSCRSSRFGNVRNRRTVLMEFRVVGERVVKRLVCGGRSLGFHGPSSPHRVLALTVFGACSLISSVIIVTWLLQTTVHDGHFYEFFSSFLSLICVKVTTKETKWANSYTALPP